jgi:hypothetical protein
VANDWPSPQFPSAADPGQPCSASLLWATAASLIVPADVLMGPNRGWWGIRKTRQLPCAMLMQPELVRIHMSLRIVRSFCARRANACTETGTISDLCVPWRGFGHSHGGVLRPPRRLGIPRPGEMDLQVAKSRRSDALDDSWLARHIRGTDLRLEYGKAHLDAMSVLPDLLPWLRQRGTTGQHRSTRQPGTAPFRLRRLP